MEHFHRIYILSDGHYMEEIRSREVDELDGFPAQEISSKWEMYRFVSNFLKDWNPFHKTVFPHVSQLFDGVFLWKKTRLDTREGNNMQHLDVIFRRKKNSHYRVDVKVVSKFQLFFSNFQLREWTHGFVIQWC